MYDHKKYDISIKNKKNIFIEFTFSNFKKLLIGNVSFNNKLFIFEYQIIIEITKKFINITFLIKIFILLKHNKIDKNTPRKIYISAPIFKK